MLGRPLIITTITLGIFIAVINTMVPQSPKELPAPVYNVKTDVNNPQHNLAVAFRDNTLRWQIAPYHQQTTKELSAITETLGSGICAIDANRDGWMDLFFIGGSGHTRYFGRKSWWYQKHGNQLLINNNGQFMTNQSHNFGIDDHISGMGCAVADFNLDGWPDLVVTGLKSIKLYKNTGNNSFVEISQDAGLVNEYWSTGVSVGDFNNDGLFDIYINNYIKFQKGAKTFEHKKGFASGSVAFEPSLYDPPANQFYINQGNFKFKEAAAELGIANSLGRSLGAKWVDLNNDNWTDLVVVNDAGSPSQVYLNNQGQRFERSETQFNLLEARDSHDIAFADLNRDTVIDAFITRQQGRAPVLMTSTQTTDSTTSFQYKDTIWESSHKQHQYLSKDSWGVIAQDINNDGHRDLYIATGTIQPDSDSHFVPQGQSNLLLLSNNGRFFNVPTLQHQQPMSSRGAIQADLNNDGRLELIVTNNNDSLQIIENKGSAGNWVGFDLLTKNTSARVEGTRITVTTNSSEQTHRFNLNPTFLSQGDHRVHFGLNNEELVKQLEIIWPDGSKLNKTNIKANQYYSIEKSNRHLEPIAATPNAPLFSQRWIESLSNMDKSRLAQLLAKIATPESTYQLFNLWESLDSDTKISVLDHLKSDWDGKYTWLVQDALRQDSSYELQRVAINLLKQMELEPSVRWLTPHLASDNHRLSCDVAKVFQFFFEEEEAVTHRKYLAVSPLIKALEDGPEIAVCAANALAAAERKRATIPLLQLLTTNLSADMDKNIQVKSAAIRALGLIRDIRAVEQLEHIGNNFDSYPPKLVAESLIALKRINYSKLDQIIAKLNRATETTATGLQALTVIAELFLNDEGIVLKRNTMIQQTHKIIGNLDIDTTDANLLNPLITIIWRGNLSEHYDLLARLTSHSSEQIRFASFKALIENKQLTQSGLETELLSLPTNELVNILAASQPNLIAISNDGLNILLTRLSLDQPMWRSLPVLVRALNTKSKNILLSPLLTSTRNTKQSYQVEGLCDALKSIELAEFIFPKNFEVDSPNRLHALNCILSNSNMPHIAAINNIGYKVIINKALNSKLVDEQARTGILLSAANSDEILSDTLLVPFIENIPEPLKTDAIRAIANHPISEKTAKKLWSLSKSKDTTAATRLETLTALLGYQRDQVIDYLQQEVYPDGTL